MARRILPIVGVALVLGLLPAGAGAATCADYPDQASAQAAQDTRDADGDGLFCEDNPCPCSSGSADPAPDAPPTASPSCVRTGRVVRVRFSATQYRTIRAHARKAIRLGWPRTLILNRPHADARRDRLVSAYETRTGYDRDEYPPAVGRGRGPGLSKGRDPRGWRGHVAYVPSSENRSHGASLGNQLEPYCNGTKFRYVFY